MQTPTKWLSILVCCLGTGLSVACSEISPVEPRPDGAELDFVMTAPGDNAIDLISVDVSGPGIDSALVFNFQVANGVATGVARVPSGASRRVVARAFDRQGVNTHRSDTTVALIEGSNPTLAMSLPPLVGNQPLDVTFAATPGPTTILVVVIEVDGPGIDSTLVFNWQLNAGVASGTLRIPAGSDRRITAVAFDRTGSPTNHAETMLTVVEGDNPSRSLVLSTP